MGNETQRGSVRDLRQHPDSTVPVLCNSDASCVTYGSPAPADTKEPRVRKEGFLLYFGERNFTEVVFIQIFIENALRFGYHILSSHMQPANHSLAKMLSRNENE